MGASDVHDRLAREFVMKVAAETKDFAELMVVIESAVTASMVLLVRVHGFTPGNAAEMVEAAIGQAMERFAAQDVRHG